MLLGGPVEIMQAIIGCSWTTCILFVEHSEGQRLFDDHYIHIILTTGRLFFCK